jgi:hypothetical protein
VPCANAEVASSRAVETVINVFSIGGLSCCRSPSKRFARGRVPLFPKRLRQRNVDEQSFIFALESSARPHPEEPRRGVSKDKSRDAAAGPAWFETALARLLTMRGRAPGRRVKTKSFSILST